MGQPLKSKYHPERPEKYVGDAKSIICRSSWERKFCRWCDLNENILKWGSEEFCIPYVSPVDRRVHRYFPDFIIQVREKTGNVKKYVIEVKPFKQTQPPQKGKKSKKTLITETKTYAVNQAKWKAAEEWCKDRMLEFKVITEHELGIKYSK